MHYFIEYRQFRRNLENYMQTNNETVFESDKQLFAIIHLRISFCFKSGPQNCP